MGVGRKELEDWISALDRVQADLLDLRRVPGEFMRPDLDGVGGRVDRLKRAMEHRRVDLVVEEIRSGSRERAAG